MSVTCDFNGRLGNILINISHVIAHCKKHDLQWFFPTHAWACINQTVPISVPNTGTLPFQPMVYHEPVDGEGHPYYHDIPVRDNVLFRGYYQSFRYFDEYRQDILDIINFPYQMSEGIVGLHIRRGDVVSQPDAFPMAPPAYYHEAIAYMIERGYNNFRIFSDDIPYCRLEFTNDNYPGCTFEFIENGTDVSDFTALHNCEHIITAASTFSLMAGWFNRNPNKMILCPSITRQKWWTYQNRNLLDTQFLTQITW